MPKFAANLSMLYREVPFQHRFAAAAHDGFRGVEYLFPYDYSPEQLKRILQQHELEQVLFNLPAGDFSKGERGIACLPDRVHEYRAGVETAIRYANELGCCRLNCLSGIVPRGLKSVDAEAIFIDNLNYTADSLQSAGIELLIEMLNTVDVPGFFLRNTQQALGVLAKVGHPNIKIQYDIYHMQIMEGDICRRIKRNLERIGHIQIADNPGRHEPDTGELNFPFIFDWLERINYDGWIGCEYTPSGATSDSFSWMMPYTE